MCLKGGNGVTNAYPLVLSLSLSLSLFLYLFSVRHVDGRKIRLSTTRRVRAAGAGGAGGSDVLSPGCLRMVEGEGMPTKDGGGLKRGLLVSTSYI